MRGGHFELYNPKEGSKDKRDICEIITRRIFLKYEIASLKDIEQPIIQNAILLEAKENGLTSHRLAEHIAFCMGKKKKVEGRNTDTHLTRFELS